ncbi:MAG: pyridoxal phosphate-dependent aminotransferase [Desulfobacteraceae bacterium]|nr:MAG: pyridoxal phosphate-dependent aminotransferase [Desulfobacteraceae bacterium]
MEFKQADKLKDVCYDIRGPIMRHAQRLEEEGHRIIKLNIGNPALFGLFAPDKIISDITQNIKDAEGYSDSKGLSAARNAIMRYCDKIGIKGVQVSDIYTGNGVSELIVMSMQALLNDGDEILIPTPDYPLWTAAVNLSGGKPVHYLCDEQSDWMPDIQDIKRKISSRTKGIVVINPNNPTGAIYSRDVLESIIEVARHHKLIVFADEIYEQIVYDGIRHVPIASIADDVFTITLNGLSKAYRLAGFRSGWMVLSGDRSRAGEYIEGLDVLASMRLCSNVVAQLGIQTALNGSQSIDDLILPGGRLREQRDLCYRMITEIPGITCVKPRGALYLFPKIDQKRFKVKDDTKMILDLLLAEKVLLVQGTGFNWPNPDHFRIVFLPNTEELKEAIGRIARFFSHYTQE